MEIRKSEDIERKEIVEIHKQAFREDEGETIAQLVDDLFDDETAEPIHSFVVIEDNKIVGHILYTSVSLAEKTDNFNGQILAPLAIHPDSQGKGLGQSLVNETLEKLKQINVGFVFVLGHPAYYPKCGFVPAGEQGFDAPYPIPAKNADAWMVKELNGNLLGKISGTVQCSKVLNEPQHWRE